MPRTVTSTGGSVVHMRPLPSDSTTHDRAGLGDAEVRAADADLRAAGSARAGRARDGLGEVARVVGDRSRAAIVRAKRSRISRAVAVDRRHEDVRRPVAVELEDQLGEVGLERVDAAVGERVVEVDLVGRQRLDLDDLVGAVARATTSTTIAFASAASRAQCTWPPAAVDRRPRTAAR